MFATWPLHLLVWSPSIFTNRILSAQVIQPPKMQISQILAAASLAGLSLGAPHRDSPQQRLAAGLELPDKFKTSAPNTKGAANAANAKAPYTPGHRDPYDRAIDPDKEGLDPLPFRNGWGASVLGPWNPSRSRQDPDLVRPPSTDHGNMANMRWSFADSHVRIEVCRLFCMRLARSIPC